MSRVHINAVFLYFDSVLTVRETESVSLHQSYGKAKKCFLDPGGAGSQFREVLQRSNEIYP